MQFGRKSTVAVSRGSLSIFTIVTCGVVIAIELSVPRWIRFSVMGFEISGFLAFSAAMVWTVFFLYHWWGMLHNIREDRKVLAPFLGGVLPFVPGLYTEKGNYHRQQIGWCVLVFVIVMIVALVVDSYERGLIHGPSY